MSEQTVIEEIDFDKYCKILDQDKSVLCYSLNLEYSPIEELSPKIGVINRINLSNCTKLTKLPDFLDCNQLILRDCTALTTLPRGVCVRSLIISGCTGLTELPKDMLVEHMEFVARGCSNLQSLDGIYFNLTKLDLRGCSLLSSIPDDVSVNFWIDIGGTQITELPDSLHNIQFQWNGVPINKKTAFYPNQLTAKEILSEFNAEIRRAMIERMGYEKFFELVNPKIIDEDEDPGGLRQLLRINLMGDEPVVALSVLCPSTGRKYIIRVPPQLSSCHQAAAWIAGFDNPTKYKPKYET